MYLEVYGSANPKVEKEQNLKTYTGTWYTIATVSLIRNASQNV